MDGVGLGSDGCVEYVLFVQVAVCRIFGADAHGHVGQLYVQGIGVGIGVDGDGLNAQFLAGTDDTHGDFAAVGNQHTFKHRVIPPKKVCSFLFSR